MKKVGHGLKCTVCAEFSAILLVFLHFHIHNLMVGSRIMVCKYVRKATISLEISTFLFIESDPDASCQFTYYFQKKMWTRLCNNRLNKYIVKRLFLLSCVLFCKICIFWEYHLCSNMNVVAAWFWGKKYTIFVSRLLCFCF